MASIRLRSQARYRERRQPWKAHEEASKGWTRQKARRLTEQLDLGPCVDRHTKRGTVEAAWSQAYGSIQHWQSNNTKPCVQRNQCDGPKKWILRSVGVCVLSIFKSLLLIYYFSMIFKPRFFNWPNWFLWSYQVFFLFDYNQVSLGGLVSFDSYQIVVLSMGTNW